jgi:hypothetical protein
VVLEMKNFKDFPHINTCTVGFPKCGTILSPGGHDLTNLILHYVTKLLSKFELFWFSDSGEENF